MSFYILCCCFLRQSLNDKDRACLCCKILNNFSLYDCHERICNEQVRYSQTNQVTYFIFTYSEGLRCWRLAFTGGFRSYRLLSHQPTGNRLCESMSWMCEGRPRWWSRWTHSSGPTILVMVAAQIWLGLAGFTASSFMPRSNSWSSVPWQEGSNVKTPLGLYILSLGKNIKSCNFIRLIIFYQIFKVNSCQTTWRFLFIGKGAFISEGTRVYSICLQYHICPRYLIIRNAPVKC